MNAAPCPASHGAAAAARCYSGGIIGIIGTGGAAGERVRVVRSAKRLQRCDATQGPNPVKPPLLKTAMTPFPHAVDVDEPLARATEFMQAHDVRHLPVTEEARLVGVVSERDIRGAPLRRGARGLRVRDVYVPDLYIVDLNEPLDNVLLTMAERHIGSAIVTRKGRLAGLFTYTDACRSFGEYLRERYPRGGDDVA